MTIRSKIPFKVIDSFQRSSNTEGVEVDTTEDKVILQITKQFATPGYSMDVDEVIKENNECIISLSIKPPKVDAMLMQVITNKTIVIEIDKEKLGTFKQVKLK